MALKHVLLTGVLAMWLTGCATSPNMDAAWPQARPLGNNITAYRPSPQPVKTAPESIEIREPAGEITLSETLALALMHNPELAAFSWEVRAGEARVLQAGLFPNPEIEVEMEEFGGTDERRGIDSAETTVQLSQLVELGGKRHKRQQLTSLERDMSGWDYEAKRLDVFTETTKVFIEVLAAQERLSLTRELIRLAEQVLAAVSERVRAGKVSPLEKVRAKASLSIVKIEGEQAKRSLLAVRKKLVASWGGAGDIFEKVIGRLEMLTPPPSTERLSNRVLQNPDIARWVTEAAQRRAALELEKTNRIVDITLSGGVAHFNETDDTAYVLGLSVPLPIFNRNQGGILEAQYKLNQAKAERQAAQTRVHTALAETYQALVFAYTEADELKEKVLPQLKQVFESTNEGYRQGKFSYLEMLDAQRTLFEAKKQYIKALSSYHLAVADMERLIGEKLNTVKPVPQEN